MMVIGRRLLNGQVFPILLLGRRRTEIAMLHAYIVRIQQFTLLARAPVPTETDSLDLHVAVQTTMNRVYASLVADR